jgi:hypothetical protein
MRTARSTHYGRSSCSKREQLKQKQTGRPQRATNTTRDTNTTNDRSDDTTTWPKRSAHFAPDVSGDIWAITINETRVNNRHNGDAYITDAMHKRKHDTTTTRRIPCMNLRFSLFLFATAPALYGVHAIDQCIGQSSKPFGSSKPGLL